MAKAYAAIRLDVGADQVWQLIGGFNTLPDWLPYIPHSTLQEGGRVRHLVNPDGGIIIERLISFDENRRCYTYRILQAPFPVKNYLSTLQVSDGPDGRGTVVEWSGEFTPANVSEQEVSALFQGIYEDGLKALKAYYEN